MAKIDPNFAHDMFLFLHKPIRDLDAKEGGNFVERFLTGPQFVFEETEGKIEEINTILDPARTRADLLQYLKDHVGFTKELNNITNDLGENDLRKLISLAVALWKQKGTEPGYINIVRLFTGKSARVFNYFDFRWIIGETQFGESQLGDDPFLISGPGIEKSVPIANVVALFGFENDALDRSRIRNDGTVHGAVSDVFFYLTPNSGFPGGSEYYARFVNNVISVPNSGAYDFSDSFCVEFFFRTTNTFTWKTLCQKMDLSGVGWKIELNTSTNEIRYTLDDGTSTFQRTHSPATVDLDDGGLHHIALSVDRVNDLARLFVKGDLSESDTAQDIDALDDPLTNSAKMYFGGSGVGLDVAPVDMDNFRLSLRQFNDTEGQPLDPGDVLDFAVYDPQTVSNFPEPLVGFIEFQPELLDEFQTDIRIVDDGDLNKTLILRILNLMRPTSERLNVIFVRFFDDFLDGIGQFARVIDGPFVEDARVNIDGQMELDPFAWYVTAVLNDTEFKNILLAASINDIGSAGSDYSVVFNYQDPDNFYEFRIDSVNRRTAVFKTVGGAETQIGSWIDEDIVPGASYFYSVTTSYDELTGDTQIQTYVDSNRQHVVVDSAFEKGKFGFRSGATGIQIGEVEMMQLPVDVRRIDPGFDL